MLKLRGKLNANPWEHLYFDNVFDQETYTAILKQLPAMEDMLESDTPDRKMWPLPEEGFWGRVHLALCNGRLTKALRSKLGVARSCFPKAAVIRDLPGHEELPNRGMPNIVMSFIIFLPTDTNQALLGPRFLKVEKGQVVRGKQIGFFSNVGICYEHTSKAWFDFPKLAVTRNLLQVNFYNAP